MSAIKIESLSFRYRAASSDALRDISLTIGDGEFVVVMGPNEAGKSTLCLTLNGLIPHLVRGTLSGRVTTLGLDTQENTVKELFPRIGLVLQDFESVTPNVLCRAMETVEGGGCIVMLFNTLTSLKQLY